MKFLFQRSANQQRTAVVDIVAMIVLALGIGLATGVVLGGTVLLFSSGQANVVSDAAALRAGNGARP